MFRNYSSEIHRNLLRKNYGTDSGLDFKHPSSRTEVRTGSRNSGLAYIWICINIFSQNKMKQSNNQLGHESHHESYHQYERWLRTSIITVLSLMVSTACLLVAVYFNLENGQMNMDLLSMIALDSKGSPIGNVNECDPQYPYSCIKQICFTFNQPYADHVVLLIQNKFGLQCGGKFSLNDNLFLGFVSVVLGLMLMLFIFVVVCKIRLQKGYTPSVKVILISLGGCYTLLFAISVVSAVTVHGDLAIHTWLIVLCSAHICGYIPELFFERPGEEDEESKLTEG
jgi:hypothetical protein